MANLAQIIPALFVKDGELLTPEQIKRRQALSANALAFATDTSPNAGGVASILAKGLAGFRSGWEENRANAALEAAGKENQSLISSLLGGLGGNGGLGQTATAATPTVAPMQNVAPSGGQTVASLTAGGVDPVAEVLSNPNTTPAEKTAQIEYIRYANQGATRNQPLNDKLTSALGFLPELGVTAEVFSGGQPAKGSGLARVGSVRHDDGNAADVFFYKDGRRLDWANENDRPLFQEIVKRGRAAGITGFGAGPGYMQQGSMHIGFGSPGVWGAGGRGANAPDWLRAAYGESPNPSNRPMQRAPMPTYAQASNGVNPAIIAALSSPVANEQTRSVATALLNNQMAQQQAAQELALKKQQQQQAIAQRQAIAQSMGINPGVALDDTTWKSAVEAANRGRQTATVNGTVIDVNSGQPIFQAPQQPTTSIQDYNFYADSERQAGRQPLGPLEYEQAIRSAGAARTNIDTGTVPQGYQAIRDEQGRLIRYDPVPGGPADTAKTQAKAAANTQRSSNIVLEDVDRAVSAIESNPTLTTGIIGNWSRGIGGTPANKVQNLLQTVRANSAFDRLQQMREASPTGGALGAVSDSELGLLQNAIGSLEQSNNSEDLVYNLRRVQRIYEDIINGPEAAKKMREERAKAGETSSQPAQGWKDLGNGVKIRPKGSN